MDENECMAPLAGSAAVSGGSDEDDEEELLMERKGKEVSMPDESDWGDDNDAVVVVVVVVVVDVVVTTELTALVRPEKSNANGLAMVAYDACLLGVSALAVPLVGALGPADCWRCARPLAVADVGRLAFELELELAAAETGRPP